MEKPCLPSCHNGERYTFPQTGITLRPYLSAVYHRNTLSVLSETGSGLDIKYILHHECVSYRASGMFIPLPTVVRVRFYLGRYRNIALESQDPG